MTACGGRIGASEEHAIGDGGTVDVERLSDVSDVRLSEGSSDSAPASGDASASDARSTGDASSDAGTVYHDFRSSSFWSLINVGIPSDAGNLQWQSYNGATFDGRFLYIAPADNGPSLSTITRYDTQARFLSLSSWSMFDPWPLEPSNWGAYAGTVFDGRYVYMVPASYGGANQNAVIARYDTLGGAFSVPGSWTMFDLASLGWMQLGFYGGTFDGRYVYLASNYGPPARYDTTLAFTSPAAWSRAPNGYCNSDCYGAVFDGRFIYLARTGGATRYDTTSDFGSSGSWTTLDLPLPDGGSFYADQEAFDGRYYYLVPSSGPAVRYDTSATFTDPQSWTTFDMTRVDPGTQGYNGVVFDGRYLYFVPRDNVLVRYDTTVSFPDTSAWATLDISGTISNLGMPFAGGVFDGEYVYLLASPGAARFDARTPPSMPNLPEFHGSFF